MIDALHDRLASTLICLETLSSAGQADLLYLQATTHGGRWKVPQPNNTWDDQLFDIQVHGVSATGIDMSDAIRNWTKAAQAALEARTGRPDIFTRAVNIVTGNEPATHTDAFYACQIIITYASHASPAILRRAYGYREALQRVPKPATNTAA